MNWTFLGIEDPRDPREKNIKKNHIYRKTLKPLGFKV